MGAHILFFFFFCFLFFLLLTPCTWSRDDSDYHYPLRFGRWTRFGGVSQVAARYVQQSLPNRSPNFYVCNIGDPYCAARRREERGNPDTTSIGGLDSPAISLELVAQTAAGIDSSDINVGGSLSRCTRLLLEAICDPTRSGSGDFC